MQNPIPKFRHGSISFEKPGELPEKLKSIICSNYHRAFYFLPKFCKHFLFSQVYKRVFILFISCVIDKKCKNPVFENEQKPIL